MTNVYIYTHTSFALYLITASQPHLVVAQGFSIGDYWQIWNDFLLSPCKDVMWEYFVPVYSSPRKPSEISTLKNPEISFFALVLHSYYSRTNYSKSVVLKCGWGCSSSSSSICELVRNSDSWSHTRPNESEALVADPRNLCFNKTFRVFCYMLKFEKHC